MSTLQRESNSIEVRFDDNLLKAYIEVIPVDMENLFTKEQILEELATKNVIYGIKIDAVEDIVNKKLVHIEVLVAEGDKAIDGEDGSYQYFFNKEIDSKPIILEDGSADYSSLSRIEKVTEGQIIAKYIKATKGVNGKNVKGQQILAKNGRDLLPIAGTGFMLSEDKTVYTSKIDGKIEFKNDKIEISDILIIEGDVDSKTGDADFTGDITVRGNVMTGVKVKAGRNILVIGHVEAADLVAGGDIVLQNGMQGGGRGTIAAGGNVSGKFFEQVTIQANGNINANAIMHCKINSQGQVVVSGKRGVIVGGVINAATGVTATIIGSIAEVQTEVNIGYESDPVPEIINRENEIKNLIEEIRKIDEVIKVVIAYIEREKRDDLLQRKIQLLKKKIDLNSQISIITKQRNELLEDLERGKDAKVIVMKVIYPRVRIRINGSSLVMKEEFSHVLIKRKGIDVCVFAVE